MKPVILPFCQRIGRSMSGLSCFMLIPLPRLSITILLYCFVCTTGAQAIDVAVGEFTTTASIPPAPWQMVHLDKRVAPTRYQVIAWDGVVAVEAVAEHSMALLARPLDINLQQTPILCWLWRVDAPLVSADMNKKSGDDYAARVYVSFKLPPQQISLGTRVKLGLARTIYGNHVPDAAINYIWDNRYPVGTLQANAYTNRTQMLVLQSGAGQAGRWVAQRRDVLADARLAFGLVDPNAVQLAIAADTDNTGESARAGFAHLHFVDRESDCAFPEPGGIYE
jgi:hypothetical protein